MGILTLKQMTHDNYKDALAINRDDIPEAWVDNAASLMKVTDYGAEHHLMGHTYIAYMDGKIAVEMFAEHAPGYYDAILMDMRMPEMDGLEATKAIRAMDRTDAGTIPIIALTANAFDEDVQRSMQAGLNAHLSKPVEPEILFSTLERLICN